MHAMPCSGREGARLDAFGFWDFDVLSCADFLESLKGFMDEVRAY